LKGGTPWAFPYVCYNGTWISVQHYAQKII